MVTDDRIQKMIFMAAAFVICGVLASQQIFAAPKEDSPSQKDRGERQRPVANHPLGELSLRVSGSRSDFGNGSYSRSRRFVGSVGFNLSDTLELELTYSDARTFYNSAPGPQSTADTWDRTLSLTLNQSLMPRTSLVQPYVKAGAAQLNRIQSTTYDGVQQPDSVLKQPSGVLGGGIRIYLMRQLSLRFELTAYLPDFHISAAKENYDWDGGLSYHF